MLRHLLFQPSQSFWTAVTFLSATLTPLLTASPLGAQTVPTSSTSLIANPTPPLCSDLGSTPCPPPPVSPVTAAKPHTETSFSLGSFAQLTPTRLQNNTYDNLLLSTQTQGIAPTPGVLGTFRQQFRPWLGYSVKVGYTRVDERYNLPLSAQSLPRDLHFRSSFYEFSFSYVAAKHLTPHLSLFGDLGAGMIMVVPRSYSFIGDNQPFSNYAINYRPQGVTGFGLDYRLSDHFDFRAEYRGLLYKNPDFGGLQKSTTWTSEPTLSLVYRFGRNHTSPSAKP